jgi:hypothetical protein
LLEVPKFNFTGLLGTNKGEFEAKKLRRKRQACF